MSARNNASERRDERRNQPVRARGRKDRARWCGGKFGREHQRVYGKLSNHWSARRGCGWTRDCGWAPYGKSYRGGPAMRWSCTEQEYCAVCGKIFRDSLDVDCTRRWLLRGCPVQCAVDCAAACHESHHDPRFRTHDVAECEARQRRARQWRTTP